MSDRTRQARWMMLLVMGAVVIWGLFHTVGALRGGGGTGVNPWRGLIVAGSFAGFLGMWAVALWARERKLDKKRDGR